jgi:hypothetical protein
MKGILLFILTVFIFISCTPKPEFHSVDGVTSTYTHHSFKESKKLQGKLLDLGTVLAPLVLFHHDSLLFISSVGLPWNVKVFDMKNQNSEVGEILSRGMGPEEVLSALSISFSKDGSFWVHDPSGSQMKQAELFFEQGQLQTRVSEISRFAAPVTSSIFLNNHKFVTVCNDINPFKRFYVFDSVGYQIDAFGEYPTYEREIPNSAAVEVFMGRLTVHPNRDKFLMAYDYTDLIEIYSSDFELLHRVQGPHGFLPEFGLKERGSHQVMSRVYGHTKQAFYDVISNEEYIFLLYGDGKSRAKGSGESGVHYDKIVVLDWEGQAQMWLELDHPVTSICVDWKGKIVYGLDRIESQVYAFAF